MGKSVRIDVDGELRCWNCGSKNLETRRRTKSKFFGAAIGVAVIGPLGAAAALAAKKRLRCQGCGEYNDVGSPEPIVEVLPPSSLVTRPHRPAEMRSAAKDRRRRLQDQKPAAAEPNESGWYPDPQGAPRTLRFWDGTDWTADTSPD
ncbi:MAG: DUF2510 domain-containing protein [Dietzia sp.]|nr:DUF2510 domain-containing protein [Dietzia sp.]